MKNLSIVSLIALAAVLTGGDLSAVAPALGLGVWSKWFWCQLGNTASCKKR